MAALLRWLHDRLGIRYHQMALGEAATALPSVAAQYTSLHGGSGPITPEAVIEGRSGDFYGGWGFYFARKYLVPKLKVHAIALFTKPRSASTAPPWAGTRTRPWRARSACSRSG